MPRPTRRRRDGGADPAVAGVAALVERVTGLTPAGLVVLGGSVLGFVLARLVGGRALFLLVYAGVLMVMAAAITSRRKRRLQAERSALPTRMRVGQVAEVEVTVRAPGRLRAFVVQEHLSNLLSDPVRVPVPTVGGEQEFVHTYAIRPTLRGVYQLGPLAAEWTDPFGLARHQQQLTEPVDVIVHPATDAIFDRPLTRMWEDPPFRPPVSKPWPQGFEFYGMRDYVRGDDPRRIVWTAMARTGKYLVRESEQGITDRVTLVLDNARKAHSPGYPSETFELAIRAVASLGAYNIKQGFSVRLLSNDAGHSPELRGGRARIALLDELAELELSDAPVHDAVERVITERRGDTHLCLVSTGFDSRTASRMQLLTDKGMSLVVALVRWEDADPNAARRAREVGAQVVQVSPGQQLETAFAHALGLAMR
ncbi:MAG: hypothetical protein QOE05_124 [Actinomycetota bacterium]|jgi:uncharacterized protein (DUF58 family)|nr:hypothetical protein [Actinomycetota bacterium]